MNLVSYYDRHAQAYFDRTIDVDLHDGYAKFFPYLPSKARILDAGCGSGRDTLYFKQQGFDTVAFDASIEMVKLSSNLLGSPTLHLRFQELTFKEDFDGVWASASLLHVPYDELSLVLQKLHMSLKIEGILYATFKYGHGRREADSRIFYDMNEESVLPFMRSFFTPLEIWTTPDNRSTARSPHQAWLNILVQKR
jgi:SAM-dependent methyltransferase